MEEPFSSRKKSAWQKKLLWIELSIFILSMLSICMWAFLSRASPPCRFTHKTSFAGSMTDQESKTLTVSFYGENFDCKTYVRLAITNFDISPSDNVQEVTILAQQTTQIQRVLYPKSQGKFSYVVSFPDSQALSADESVVTVTNAVGFPAWVTSILAPLAGLIFGPLLTIPYWIDKSSMWIKKRKGKQKTRVGKARKRTKNGASENSSK